MKPRSRILFVLPPILLLLAALFWATKSSPAPLLAQSQPTPTPCVTEPTPAAAATPAWTSARTGRVPGGLQKTVSLGGGGGPDYEVFTLCGDILGGSASGDPIFRISRDVALDDRSEQWSDDAIYLELCRGELPADTVVELTDPEGKAIILEPQRGEQISDIVPQENLYFVHKVDLSSPPGEYVFAVDDGRRVMSTTVQVEIKDYLRDLHNDSEMALSDPVSGAPRSKQELSGRVEARLAPGESVDVLYSDFPPQKLVDVGLYGLGDGFDLDLLTGWTIETDASGAYSHTLTIPEDTAVGDYVLLSAVQKPEEFQIRVTVSDTVATGEGAEELPPAPPVPDEEAPLQPTLGEPLFYDDFSDPSSGLPDMVEVEAWGLSFYDPEYEEYVFDLFAESLVFQTYDFTLPDPFIFSASTAIFGPDDGAGGLLFQVGPDGYYAFLISRSGEFIALMLHDGEWLELIPWTASSAIESDEGVYNLLAVAGDGPNYTLFVNGEAVGAFTDDTYRAGSVALMGVAGSDSNVVVFDDVTVTSQDEPLGLSLPRLPANIARP